MAAPEKLMHKAHRTLLNGTFRTSVVVIGAGGTGTHIVHGLAMLHNALIQLGHNGLAVNVYDDDVVEPHNVGRQRFGWADVGANKAHALIAHVNRLYGLDWRAGMRRFDPKNGRMGNILITAVDNGSTRNAVHRAFKMGIAHNDIREVQEEHQELVSTHYWLDLGNGDKFGQVVLAAHDLPTCVDLFGRYGEEESVGSCSAQESLTQQDLFINQSVATAGLSLLWDLFRRGKVTSNVIYLNLKDHTMRSTFKPLIHDHQEHPRRKGKRRTHTR